MAARTPVYFVSHGGPNIMFETSHPAHKYLAKIGREITQTIKPKAVVVFSAHWQAGQNHVEVNVDEKRPLIYDYHGFPAEYYKVKYPHVGSAALSSKVLDLLKGAGIDARPAKRGLDHGVFAPFICMFNPESNPLGVPIVQVSLYNNEDADKHFELGRAVESLRDEGVLVIGSGMAVHNLRDIGRAMQSGKEMPYAKPFDLALKRAVLAGSNWEERKTKLRELLADKDARNAHPTFEHLLPVHIAGGAAGDDRAERVFTMTEMSVSWAQYRFGAVSEPVQPSQDGKTEL